MLFLALSFEVAGEMHKFSQRKDTSSYMKLALGHDEIGRQVAIKRAPRGVFPRLNVAASRLEKPQEAGVSPSVVVGRAVQSPKYGRGYVAEVGDDAVRSPVLEARIQEISRN